ncbi:MAG: hypothetical protein KAI39_12315 [Desulfobulbaceae bacterium]|nr:hypothetical protein [Desulfobulbaceae bacterium]
MTIAADEIGFDLDGVIADTAESFLRIACSRYGYCSFTREDITNFELENCIPIPGNLVEQIFTEILTDSLAAGLQPMAGAVETLTLLAENSPVTIITARPLLQPVLDWIDVFFPAKTRDATQVIATGDHNDKVRYIHEYGLKYFVDDRAETCMQLAGANIIPLVFSQPWNQNRHNLQSVENWADVRELITPQPEKIDEMSALQR